MDIFSKNLDNYLEQHTSDENPILKELERETHLKHLKPRMLSGFIQGRFLAMISKMIQPRYVLEIGTFVGYSAICIAEGLKPDGKLHTIEVDPELESIAHKYFKKTKMEDKIKLHLGDAKEIIPQLDMEFQMVFIDADKLNYALYYDLVIDKISPGGLLIADNVLWDGKVFQTDGKIDKKTKGMIEFNKKVQSDKRVENTIIPLRDGLILALKK